MKTYLCPKCGSYMHTVPTLSMPPMARYRCGNCGYTSKPDKEEDWAVPLPRELRSDIIIYEEMFELFKKCRVLAISDYRPVEEMYIKDIDRKKGIIVWFENGDSMLYFPKLEDANDR